MAGPLSKGTSAAGNLPPAAEGGEEHSMKKMGKTPSVKKIRNVDVLAGARRDRESIRHREDVQGKVTQEPGPRWEINLN